MPNIDELERILERSRQEFNQLPLNDQQFLQYRIINGNSIFGWHERILSVAYGLFQRRRRYSTPEEQNLDYQTAGLIVQIQQYNLAKRKRI